jgi:hypothetical protein
MWVKRNLILVYLEIVLILAQDRCMVCIPWAWKCFWSHPMEVLGDEGQVEARFGLLGEGVNLDAK